MKLARITTLVALLASTALGAIIYYDYFVDKLIGFEKGAQGQSLNEEEYNSLYWKNWTVAIAPTDAAKPHIVPAAGKKYARQLEAGRRAYMGILGRSIHPPNGGSSTFPPAYQQEFIMKSFFFACGLPTAAGGAKPVPCNVRTTCLTYGAATQCGGVFEFVYQPNSKKVADMQYAPYADTYGDCDRTTCHGVYFEVVPRKGKKTPVLFVDDIELSQYYSNLGSGYYPDGSSPDSSEDVP